MTRFFRHGVLLTMLCACAVGSQLREDAALVQSKVVSARANGAYQCAPAALAKAEAHLEFLDYELGRGDFLRAQRHHDVALQSVNEAIETTDPSQCAPRRVVIADGGADRDGDGVADAADSCPDEPEDLDTFEDKNGCPDPDNDADTVLDVADACPNQPGEVRTGGCPGEDRDADAVADLVDQCPDIPEDRDGIVDDDGCPEQDNPDTDGDLILDLSDTCPNDPEDMDRYLDDDGCPEPDNDMDSVLDSIDLCPLQPGPPASQGCPVVDRDGDKFSDDVDQCPDVPGGQPHGCPERVLVARVGNRIEIKEQIAFETNRGAIRGKTSFEIIDQVTAVLISNPTLRVVIEGHTDDAGSADYNLRLSDARANAVRDALIERSIASTRLEAIGYGESKPIAPNATAKGRAANRRVDFVIVQPQL